MTELPEMKVKAVKGNEDLAGKPVPLPLDGLRKHSVRCDDHLPNVTTRYNVMMWSAMAVPEKLQASMLGISLKALRTCYAEELKDGEERTVALAASTLFNKAITKEDNALLMFFLKARGGWSEKAAGDSADNPLIVEHTLPALAMSSLGEALRAAKLAKPVVIEHKGSDLL